MPFLVRLQGKKQRRKEHEAEMARRKQLVGHLESERRDVGRLRVPSLPVPLAYCNAPLLVSRLAPGGYRRGFKTWPLSLC